MQELIISEKELMEALHNTVLPESYLNKLEQDRLNGIPVIRTETAYLLAYLMKREKPKHVLDLGTGGGCSALLALMETEAHVTTADLLEERTFSARRLFDCYGYGSRVSCVCADIGDMLQSLTGCFGFILSDWAKAQYVRSLDELERLSANGTLLVFDDANFYGMVDGSGRFFRRRRTIVSRLRELPEALEERGWPVQYVDIDNGVLLSRVIK